MRLCDSVLSMLICSTLDPSAHTHTHIHTQHTHSCKSVYERIVSRWLKHREKMVYFYSVRAQCRSWLHTDLWHHQVQPARINLRLDNQQQKNYDELHSATGETLKLIDSTYKWFKDANHREWTRFPRSHGTFSSNFEQVFTQSTAILCLERNVQTYR